MSDPRLIAGALAIILGTNVIAHDGGTGVLPAISASVPLRQEQGVLLFQATLDGVGPLLFALDPGGADVYTSYALTRLKNRVPKTLCISRACMRVKMQFFEGTPSDLDPQHDQALGVLAGSIGPQLLRHYVVRINYRASTLTLIPPARFQPTRGGRPLVLTFDSYGMPVATALVDGIPAPFELDVRAGTSMLFGPFLERTGLRRTYQDAPVVRQSGTLVAHAVHHVQINGVSLVDVPFWFSNSAAGKFASPEVGGLLANNVLSHFAVTFDVPDGKVFLSESIASTQLRSRQNPRRIRRIAAPHPRSALFF